MRSTLSILAIATLVGSLDAQWHIRTLPVTSTPTATQVRLVGTVLAPDTTWSVERVRSSLAGERIVRARDGRWVVLRRISVSMAGQPAAPSTVERSAVTIHADAVPAMPISEGDGEVLVAGSARIIDPVRTTTGTTSTLEVAVAELDSAARTLTVITSVTVLIARTDQPGVQTRAAAAGATSRSLPPGPWYRLELTETGMYALDRAYLLGIGMSGPDLENIQRLRVYGNGGLVLPEAISAPRPDGLQEIPRYIHDTNGNGRLDDGEYVAFYGRSVRTWSYDGGTGQFTHVLNPYTERNVYYLTIDAAGGGRDMDSVASASSGGVPVTDVLGRVSVDQDRFNFVRSGRHWVGQSFDMLVPSAVYTQLLPGLVPGSRTLYRTVLYSRSGSVDSFKVAENDNVVLGPIAMLPSDVMSTDQIFNYAYRTPILSFQHTGGLPGQRSILKFTFVTTNQAARGWLDWFEIFYRRSLEAESDRFLFPSPDTSALLEYTVRNFSSRSIVVFDVSDHLNVRRVSGVEFDPADASLCRFRLPQAGGSVRELAVIGATGFLAPPAARRVTMSDLRGSTAAVDFIIISPPEFLEEAERLRQHRVQRDGLRTMVVDIDDVFAEFAGGLPDPMAVRDFIAYARTHYPGPLKYVLFFGAGHYDYRNISTSVRNWVPPYETEESNYQIASYTSDDYFAMLTPGDPRISLAIGRMPARSLAEIRTMVDKIIRYDEQSPLDAWRNRITFVADDGQTSQNPDEGSLHTGQAENLARFHTPPTFDERKIYTVQYPTVIGASGRRKPQANAAVIDAFNRGSLVLNFTGHGNPRLWTHEEIFTKEASIPLLTNHDRLTFLVAATCNFAQWDNPAEQSAGELLLTMDAGGAIAEVTATRSVFSFDNAELNYELYDHLFESDSSGNPVTIGDAFWKMKQVRYGANDQKYHLLGDPTLRLNKPRGAATIDSVNGIPTSQVAMIPSLGIVAVKGSIRRPDSTAWQEFSGRGLLELFDAKRVETVPEWPGFTFEESGSLLYRGEVSVPQGRFSASIPVPKDVTFGSRSRVSLYAYSGGIDAVGMTEQVTIQGADSLATTDTTGPSIRIAVGTDEFRDGDIVPPDPALIVDLADASGINTSTVGIGHRLEAVLYPQERSIDLSDSYQGNLDTYQSGKVVTSLSGVPEGRYLLRVRAWDVRNNSSTAESAFEVRAGGATDIFQVVNYPNPFSRSTSFTMQRVTSEPVDIEVRIYTVAGRMLRKIRSHGVTDQFIAIPWDGRDAEGDAAANGVYLYRVIARTPDGGQTHEATGKLAIVR